MNHKWIVLSVMMAVVACCGQALAAVSSASPPPRAAVWLEPGSPEARQALVDGLQMYTPELPVLLIQDVYPWSYDSNALALAEAGIPFARITSAELAATDLSRTRVVMCSGDQTTWFYQNIAANLFKITDFVAAGGTLVAHACDLGWAGGDWTGLEILPGNVHHSQYFSQFVHITDPSHPVMTGLDDAYLSWWNASTHGHFADLLPGTNVVTQNDLAEPTYVDYTWGAGRVLANLHTIEWGYGDGWNAPYVYRPEFLRNEIRLIGDITARVLDVGDGLGRPGGLGAVAVDLTDVSRVAGLQFDLLYDPLMLTPVEVLKGPLISGSDWEIYSNLVEPGRLAVLAFSNTDSELTGGSGAIAQVVFAVDPGAAPGSSCVLHPEWIWLSNGVGDSIPVTGADGTFVVGSVDHFEVAVIPPPPEPQGGDLTCPLPFLVRAEAHAASHEVVTAYNGLASISASCCGVDPTSARFDEGVWEGQVSLLCDLDPRCILSIEDVYLPASGISEEFDVLGKGDPTGDAATNVLDVVRTVNIALARPIPEPPRYEFQFWSGNVNCDDSVNVQDVILVLRRSLGLPKPAVVTAAGAAAGPVRLSLVEVSRGTWELRVSNAVGLTGVQLEITVARAEASRGELAAAADWQIHASRIEKTLQVIAFSSAARGLTTSEGVLLRLTGVRGRPRLAAVVAADAMGNRLPVQIDQSAK